MRRTKQEILEKSDIEDIIRKSLVCRLAMAEGDQPYVLPLSFGYRDNTLYFHGAAEGKKIDILKKNPLVSFEFDVGISPEPHENACLWGMGYKSVVGFGKASFIEDPEKKKKALAVIMGQYSVDTYTFDDNMVKLAAVIRVDISSMTGKRSSDD